jgi:hypothetical protein
MDEGRIMVGLMEPPIRDGGPVPTLLIEDCGMRSVDDVCDKLEGPKLP